jgi:hypothetical protein
MAATNLSSNTTSVFIGRLAKDYPGYSFRSGPQEHWSPKTNTITFNPARPCYGVLHELAHALLGHNTYNTDFELLKMEAEAWDMAVKLGENYKIVIDQNHIQNCLDTYRDWLHRRSTCPSCATHVLQDSTGNYHCYNCQTSWHVSTGRFVRPYRKTLKEKTA